MIDLFILDMNTDSALHCFFTYLFIFLLLFSSCLYAGLQAADTYIYWRHTRTIDGCNMAVLRDSSKSSGTQVIKKRGTRKGWTQA